MGGASLYRQAIMGNTTPALLPPPPPPKVSNAEGILFGEKYRKVANSLVMEGEVAVVRI